MDLLTAMMTCVVLVAPQERTQPTRGVMGGPPPQELQAVRVPIPPPSRPISELVPLLDSADAATRVDAVTQLRGAANVTGDMAAKLRELLVDDPDESVRLAAARALGLLAIAGVLRDQPPWAGNPPTPLDISAGPEYPPGAFKDRLQGRVEVFTVIDEEGAVRHVEVIRSIPVFDDAALESVRKFKFRPARFGGRAIPATGVAPVVFKIY